MTFEELMDFDRRMLEEKGVTVLCGVDEAGRGPLAGPVVAACLVFRPGAVLDGLNDSKKLTEKKREQLFEKITGEDLAWYGIGSASPEEIDRVNILQATFLAMRRAYEEMAAKMPQAPQLALVDGNRDPRLPLPTVTVVKGDGCSAAIAAASVLAKVTRDREMLRLHQQYPQYRFDQHKGYPTKLHYQMLEEHGISPIHRRSFLKKLTGEQ